MAEHQTLIGGGAQPGSPSRSGLPPVSTTGQMDSRVPGSCPGVSAALSTRGETRKTSDPVFTTVPAQIGVLAELHPHAIALECDGQTLTYRELKRSADLISVSLQKLGIVPGTVVPLLLERSIHYVVSALGIMGAGAAYLPVDLHWPDARLRFVVEDSGAIAVVASRELHARLQLNTLVLDPAQPPGLMADGDVFPQETSPDQLAYLIYTSGSTGNPRGVEITHANLMHLVRWHQAAFHVTADDRASHLAGLGFDAAVWELWPHLCTGATVCLPLETVRFSAQAIRDWLLARRITISFVPTVHAAALFAMAWPASSSLRFLLTGGDALHTVPGTHLPFTVVNNYGPSECTVVSTSCAVLPGQATPPPIGRAIAGAQVYVLNEHGQLTGDGEVGEIYIAGAGVGRGYRNLPASTASAFIPDPFQSTTGARMYKTGDLGVRLENGDILFKGRADRQVKLRGFRIELDEIGRWLNTHKSLAFATAALSAQLGQAPELVAYILFNSSGQVPTMEEIRIHLSEHLPEYMVPSRFFLLEELPVSANGKIDLKLVPDSSMLAELRSADDHTPLDDVQTTLLMVMREVLKSPSFTARDNFFLAGGHSLLGMQLVLRIRKHLDVSVTIRQLFEAPTVLQLAPTVRTVRDQMHLQRVWTEVLGKAPESYDDDFFKLGGDLKQIEILQRRIAEVGRAIPLESLVQRSTLRSQAELMQHQGVIDPSVPEGVFPLRPHGSKRQMFWIHYPNPEFALSFEEDQPFFSLILTERNLRSLRPRPSLEELAALFVSKILALNPTEPIFLGGFCIGGILAYEIAQQLKHLDVEVVKLVLLDTPNPKYFNTSERPRVSIRRAHYVLKRAARIGARLTLSKARERFSKRFRGLTTAIGETGELDLVQQEVELAAAGYKAIPYDGRALLVLAADHSPDLDFEAGWRALIPGTLDVEYVNHHHTDLMKASTVRSVASSIGPHLRINMLSRVSERTLQDC